MIVVIMTTAGVMSAVMNNVAVAALMLPVVMDIARHTGQPPLAAADAAGLRIAAGRADHPDRHPAQHPGQRRLARRRGLKPLLFSISPRSGSSVMVSGIAFMVLVGRHMLPQRDVAKESAGRPKDRLARPITTSRNGPSASASPPIPPSRQVPGPDPHGLGTGLERDRHHPGRPDADGPRDRPTPSRPAIA